MALPKKAVVTLDEAALREEMRRLWSAILQRGARPDAVIGIASGGARCVDHLDAQADVKRFTCGMWRPSTDVKRGSVFTPLLRHLPYFITDFLRLQEDRALERKRNSSTLSVPRPTESLLAEVNGIAREVSRLGLRCIVVIDDAVDSGATLACVVETLRVTLPPTTKILTAVLTQTRENSLFVPDISLHRSVLFRFPWSFDFRGA